MQIDALSCTTREIEAFLRDVSGPEATQKRRTRAILRALKSGGLKTRSTGGLDEGWPQLLEKMPASGFPAGLRGRRDAWLLVLIAVLGMSSREALAVETRDVKLQPEIAIARRMVARADSAPACPACAVTRWLRVLGPAAAGMTAMTVDILNRPHGADLIHDCSISIDQQWRNVDTLLPKMDLRGWINPASPLSVSSLTSIIRHRQRAVREAPQPSY